MEGSLAEGTLIGNRWRITGYLGAGGFGEVLLAVDESEVGLGQAAVKVLHPNTSPMERDDFLREVQKVAGLRHQNLVGYLDSGLHRPGSDGAAVSGSARPYLVTELCAGSLADHLAARPGGRVSTEETVSILDDVIAGLSHLHRRRLIHRDIKAGNVLYGHDSWKLGDFGLARDLTATGSYHRGGAPIGTPLYMSPELFVHATTSGASDVYALGVLAHVCATGRPLHGGSGPALLLNIASGQPVISPDLDPALAEFVHRTTVADPAQRPATDALPALLHQHRASPTISSDPALLRRQAPTQHSGAFQAPSGSTPAPAPHPASFGAGYPPASQPQPQQFHDPRSSGQPVAPYPGWQQSGPYSDHQPQLTGQEARSRSGGRRLVLGLSAIIALGAVAIMGVGYLLYALGGDDDRESAGSLEEADASGVDGSDGSSTESGVTIEGNVEIGGGVIIGTDPVTPAEPVDDVLPHLSVVPCADGGLAGQVTVTNQADQPLDYILEVDHFNGAGTRIYESYEIVTALQPGQQALLFPTANEDGAVSCELKSFTATVAPGAGASLADGHIVSCELNDPSSFHEIVFTVTNSTPVRVDTDVTIAIVDDEGVRLDQDFGNYVLDIGPGETVQDQTSTVFRDLEKVPNTPHHCEIVAVDHDDAL